jgi:hypothetical protein
MIKKIIFTLILCSLIISCGKKGDPVFKESKGKIKMQNIIINTA